MTDHCCCDCSRLIMINAMIYYNKVIKNDYNNYNDYND